MPRVSRVRWSVIPALAMTVTLAAALAVVTGCAEKPVDYTAKKVPAESGTTKPDTESQPGVVATTGLKAEFEKEVTASLDKLDAEIRELKAKAESLKTDARARFDAAIAELDAKQKAARAKLEDLEKASAGAWEQLKRGTNAAWEELEQGVKEAAKEFGLSRSSP